MTALEIEQPDGQTRKLVVCLDFSHLPYRDLYTALRPMAKIGTWGLSLPTEKCMRTRLYWFISQALNMFSKGD